MRRWRRRRTELVEHELERRQARYDQALTQWRRDGIPAEIIDRAVTDARQSAAADQPTDWIVVAGRLAYERWLT